MYFLFVPVVCVYFLSILSSGYGDTDCPLIPSIPSDRRQNKTTLRLVQYNVEWLFIDYNANANCPGSGCSWKNTSEAQIHMQNVNNVIKTLNPDIINLCEVEECDELKDILQVINTGGALYNPYLIKGTDTSTGQNVGLITKIDPLVSLYRTEERISYPVPGSKCGYTGVPGTSGVSKHYITEFEFGGLHVVMIGLHLLAFPTDPTRCAEREAQAQVIQHVIAKYASLQYEIIVLGDFNDFDPDVIDANNNVPTSQVLDIIKGKSGELAGTYELTNLAENIPKMDRASDWYDENGDCVSSTNEFSMIDHVLVSASIREYVVNIFIYNEYAEYCSTYNSDHYPVVVDLIM